MLFRILIYFLGLSLVFGERCGCQKPYSCTKEYKPVWAKNNIKNKCVKFDNYCLLKNEVNCNPDFQPCTYCDCEDTKTTTELTISPICTELCSYIYKPVCAVNHHTNDCTVFSNECLLNKAVNCGSGYSPLINCDCPDEENSTLTSSTTEASSGCNETMFCYLIYQPVCAVNHVTNNCTVFSNNCFRNNAVKCNPDYSPFESCDCPAEKMLAVTDNVTSTTTSSTTEDYCANNGICYELYQPVCAEYHPSKTCTTFSNKCFQDYAVKCTPGYSPLVSCNCPEEQSS